MGLINCKECNNTVSDKAETCPHCGYDLKTIEFEFWEKFKKNQYKKFEEKHPLIVGWVALFIFIISIIALGLGIFSVIVFFSRLGR